MKRLAIVAVAALFTAAFAQGVTYTSYNTAEITMDVTATMPTDIAVDSAATYEVVIPASHMHPGNAFRVVLDVENNSDRDVLFWSEDILTILGGHGYVQVDAGPTSKASAAVVAPGAGQLVFDLSVNHNLKHADGGGSVITFAFTIDAEGVITEASSDITN